MTTLLARPRLLRRRPIPYWLVAGTLAAVTALLVGRLTADANAERDRWGVTRPVVVAVHDIDRGARISAGDVTIRRVPRALVAAGALREPPIGSRVAVDLHAGEVVLGDRLAGGSAVAARLPPGTRGIAVPAGSGLPLEEGDVVDVLATFDPSEAGGNDPTFAVARDAVVVAVGEDAVTVAVTEAAAPKVAYALAAGTVTLVLSAPR